MRLLLIPSCWSLSVREPQGDKRWMRAGSSCARRRSMRMQDTLLAIALQRKNGTLKHQGGHLKALRANTTLSRPRGESDIRPPTRTAQPKPASGDGTEYYVTSLDRRRLASARATTLKAPARPLSTPPAFAPQQHSAPHRASRSTPRRSIENTHN